MRTADMPVVELRGAGLGVAHLVDPIRTRAVSRPDAIALWFQKGDTVTPFTCLDLMSGMNRWSSAVSALGVGRGDIVLIFLDHEIDQYFSFFGAMQIGAIPSFMPPLTTKQTPDVYWESHAALLSRTRPKAVILSSARAEELRTHLDLDGILLITTDQAAVKRLDTPETERIPRSVGGDTDVAFLQHSSGTTQTKKGLRLSHRAVLRQLSAYTARLALTEDDRIASWLPLYHDMGLIACCVLPLVMGIPVVAIDAFEWTLRPELLLRAIGTYRCTLAWMPNFAFHHTVRTCGTGEFDLGTMRAWIDCSEPCRSATFDIFARTFSGSGVAPNHLQTCYAMAETVFAVSQSQIGEIVPRLRVDEETLRTGDLVVRRANEEGVIELLSNGLPLPGIDVAVVDAERHPLPAGQVGELTIRGDFLFSGYETLPQQTAERLVDGVYYTRDLGFLWDGEIYVLGRMDDVIIINGRNFYAHEIEALVGELPGLKPGRSVAFSIPDSAAGTDVAILLAETGTLDGTAPAALRRQVKQHVYSQTSLTLHEVHFVPQGFLLKTTSGKISRAANRSRFLANAHPGVPR